MNLNVPTFYHQLATTVGRYLCKVEKLVYIFYIYRFRRKYLLLTIVSTVSRLSAYLFLPTIINTVLTDKILSLILTSLLTSYCHVTHIYS